MRIHKNINQLKGDIYENIQTASIADGIFAERFFEQTTGCSLSKSSSNIYTINTKE